MTQQFAVGSAVTGIGIAAFTGIRGMAAWTSSSSASRASAPESTAGSSLGSTASDTQQNGVPAEKITLCGGTLAEVGPNPDGLVLTTRFPAADVSATSISGTVTLTNTGHKIVRGSSTNAPTVILSKDGIVLWHSNGSTSAHSELVDLAPGASEIYQVSFQPVICETEDDKKESFRDSLPRVPAGDYQVSAAIELYRLNGSGALLRSDLITGPVSAVTLR